MGRDNNSTGAATALVEGWRDRRGPWGREGGWQSGREAVYLMKKSPPTSLSSTGVDGNYVCIVHEYARVYFSRTYTL